VVLAAGLAAASATSLALPGAARVRLAQLTVRQRPAVWSPGRSGHLRRTQASAVALGVAVAAVAVAVLVGPVPALLAALGGWLVRRRLVRRARTRARALERARMVEACAALAGELRAGRSAAQALTAAAGLATGASRQALAAAGAAARFGGDVATALEPEPGSVVPAVQRALAACWTVCAGSGSGLADAVERLEQGLTADQAQRRAVEAELAGPRATAALLAALPAAGLLLASGLGADPVRVLLFTPVGLACLCAGLGLDALGLAWTGRLVRRATEPS